MYNFKNVHYRNSYNVVFWRLIVCYIWKLFKKNVVKRFTVLLNTARFYIAYIMKTRKLGLLFEFWAFVCDWSTRSVCTLNWFFMNNLKYITGLAVKSKLKALYQLQSATSPVCLGRTTRSKFDRTGLVPNENTIIKSVKIIWRRSFVFGIRSYD